MKRIVAILLLWLALGAFVPPLAGGSACVPGTPTPDGTLYNAPSGCKITDGSGTVWNFDGPYNPTLPGWTVIQKNGVNDHSWFGGATNSGDQIAIANSHVFMKRSRPYTYGPTDCIPGSPAELWWYQHFETNAPSIWQQTIGPGSSLTGPSMAVAGGSSFYSLAAALASVGVNGVVTIPAPPVGAPYWQMGGIIARPGVTLQGGAATQFGCSGVGSGSLVELKAPNITVKGLDAAHPLKVWGGVNTALGFRIFTTAQTPTFRDLDVGWAMDCIESSGNQGGNITLTRVFLHDCGYNSGANGNDHLAYLGFSSFAVNPDIDIAVVNGGAAYDVTNSGHLFKSRVSGGTFTNWSLYCDVAGSLNGRCDPSSLIDIPCAGKYLFQNVTLERAFSEAHTFFTFGAELSSIAPTGCPEQMAFTGSLTPGSNVITGLSADPTVLGIGVGDDISNCDADQGHCDSQFPNHSVVTGVTPTTITINNNAKAALTKPTGTWLATTGVIHFTGNTISGDNTISGLIENPAPIGVLRGNGLNTSSSVWDGIWPGYTAAGAGIAADAIVASTSGAAGNYSVTLTCASPPCVTASNTGAAITSHRAEGLTLDTCWIINDYDDGVTPNLIQIQSWGFLGIQALVKNCKIVYGPGVHMTFGARVTIGPGNLCYADRPSAGLPAFPYTPPPPSGPPVSNGKEIPCPTS